MKKKTISLKTPNEAEVAEVILRIGGGLIERKQLEKWIKRLKVKENMDMLKNLFILSEYPAACCGWDGITFTLLGLGIISLMTISPLDADLQACGRDDS